MTLQRQTSTGFVILTLAFRQEGRRWLGECMELGTATYGRSLQQVHNELVELIELDLNTLEDIGERERFFAEHGIRFHTLPPSEVTQTLSLSDDSLYVHVHRFSVGWAA